jgi:hypothetical protein
MPSLYFLTILVAMAIQTCYCQQKVLSTADLTINIEPVGTSWRDNFLNLTLLDIFGAGQVRDLLNSSNRYRLLHAENLDSLSPGCIQTEEGPGPSGAFRAAIADYTNGRTIFVTGDANAPVTPPGTPGTVRVTISQGGSTLWTLQVVRASASSGRDGSGVELRSVFYKGKKVLHRAQSRKRH